MIKKMLIVFGIIALVFILMFIILLVALGTTDTSTQIEEKESIAGDTAPVETKEVEIVEQITAAQLIEDYQANEIKADSMYKGKTFEITGTVYSISEVLGSLSVRLSDEEFAVNTVRLSLKESDKPKVAELEKGQTITVKGLIKGLGLDVEIEKVKFIEP